MPQLLSKFFSILVACLGLFVAGSWLICQNSLKSFDLDLTVMVFNTAFCFALAGLALFLPDWPAGARKMTQIIVGAFIALFSAAIVAQDILGMNFGLDQLLVSVKIDDDNPNAGRMAPLTALCFMLNGWQIILLSCPRRRWSNMAFQMISLLVLGLGFTGIAAATVRLDLLYDWYQYGRMSMPTAIGFLMLASALWLSWYHQETRVGGYLEREDKRIAVTGALIVTLVALSAGMSGFGMIAKQMEKILELGLTETRANHVKLVQDSIDAGIAGASPIATRLLLNQSLAVLNTDPNNMAARETVKKDVESFPSFLFSSIAIYSKTGQLVAQVGSFAENPALDIPLHSSRPDTQVELLWTDNAVLHLKMDIVLNNEVIGAAIVERPLPGIGALLMGWDLIGETAETKLCAPINETQMDCLPSRRRPESLKNVPRIRDGNVTSMDLAFHGKEGLRLSRDYLKRQIIAAYAPVGDTGFGIVVKIDTAEFYGPLREKLHYVVAMLLLLCGMGVFLQRAQLVPLVSRLVKSEGRIKAIMANVADVILTVTNDGTIESVSPAIADMFGYLPPQVTGQKISFLMPDAMQALGQYPIGRKHAADIEALGKGAFELLARHADGRSFTVLLAVSEMILGHEHFFVVSIRDITQRKETEKLKEEFISTISHELRTPLTSIRGSLGLIEGTLAKDLPPTVSHLVSIAHKNSERLILLINDMLDIDKIAAGQMRFDMQPQKLAAIMDQAVESNRAYAQSLNVGIDLTPIDPEIVITVDGDRFNQALSNLLSNAAKFSKPNGVIKVSTSSYAGKARICVQDFGTGIPDEFLPRIFAKFSQADASSTREKGGTGLGLHITKKIVEHMGGAIGFETKPGQGTVFWLEFPDAHTAALEAATPNANPANRRVLICEDDKDVVTILSLQMQQAGFTADPAYSIAEAREKLKANNYVALTLDLAFPSDNGLDFIRELRADPLTANLPIVVVSAKADEGRRALNGNAFGIIDWLTKPIDERHLIDALRRATVFAGKNMPQILHVEDDEDLSKMLAASLAGKAALINVATLHEAKKRLKEEDFSLIILDVALPDGNGLALLANMNDYTTQAVPVLILSANEIPLDISETVAAAMVKSRLSETKIVETILSLLKSSGASVK